MILTAIEEEVQVRDEYNKFFEMYNEIIKRIKMAKYQMDKVKNLKKYNDVCETDDKQKVTNASAILDNFSDILELNATVTIPSP